MPANSNPAKAESKSTIADGSGVAVTFHDGDVTIHRHIAEGLHASAGQRPSNFEFFDSRVCTDSYDHARIVR
jgi:hypothetical protein